MSEPFVRPNAPLCLILLTYLAPLAEVDEQMKAHVEWLGRAYAEGLFLASGRRVPRTGGVILARGRPAEVEALVATDPFVASGAASFEVIEFTASMAAPALATLLA